jgi:hypothetical protein
MTQGIYLTLKVSTGSELLLSLITREGMYQSGCSQRAATFRRNAPNDNIKDGFPALNQRERRRCAYSHYHCYGYRESWHNIGYN